MTTKLYSFTPYKGDRERIFGGSVCTYPEINLIAINGKTVQLNKKSEKAREITNGVVTCFLIGA